MVCCCQEEKKKDVEAQQAEAVNSFLIGQVQPFT